MTRRRRRVAQSGDRVVVTEGPYAGQVGLVTGIRLAPDGGLREAMVLLDATVNAGVWSCRLADSRLRVLDHPAHPITEET